MDPLAGIQWVDGSRLGDDVDDVALDPPQIVDGMKDTTAKLAEEAKKVGLQINVTKTKIVQVGN